MYVPGAAYVWVVTGSVELAVVPSPKYESYRAIVPNCTVEPDASNVDGEPARFGVTVSAATGA